jgi:hypothetical protein
MSEDIFLVSFGTVEDSALAVVTTRTEPTSSELLLTPSLESKFDSGEDVFSTDEEWDYIRLDPTIDVWLIGTGVDEAIVRQAHLFTLFPLSVFSITVKQ